MVIELIRTYGPGGMAAVGVLAGVSVTLKVGVPSSVAVKTGAITAWVSVGITRAVSIGGEPPKSCVAAKTPPPIKHIKPMITPAMIGSAIRDFGFGAGGADGVEYIELGAWLSTMVPRPGGRGVLSTYVPPRGFSTVVPPFCFEIVTSSTMVALGEDVPADSAFLNAAAIWAAV